MGYGIWDMRTTRWLMGCEGIDSIVDQGHYISL
jgi:hypothetical protein